uniref:Ig-like domain-containing protein n=1 Tax=Mola mola TaxID=94237 RepID=A0A3Q3WSA4_MOLML
MSGGFKSLNLPYFTSYYLNFLFVIQIINYNFKSCNFIFICHLCLGTAVVDVVLSCTLVEEGEEPSGMRGGGFFTQTPATLVLRDVAVVPDESLETLTPFVPPSVPDPDAILIEAKASSPEIPNADVLLHADCNDQEVMCEMSKYSPHGSQKNGDIAYFMVFLNVEAVEFSTVLIVQTLAVKDQSALLQTKLGLPLSQTGTLLTEVIFLVFTERKKVSALLRSDVVLSCGFKQQEKHLAPEVDLEWRLQHRGKGLKLLNITTRLDDGRTRKDVLLTIVNDGDASVTLTKIKVQDEGTYICTVSLGPFQAQQIIQLQVLQNSPQTLSCRCTKYYPLDVQCLLTFTKQTLYTMFPNQGSLSSHRQHGDGSYSLSSHLTVPSSISPGTEITCRVSHLALDAPLSVSLVVKSPQPGMKLLVSSLFLKEYLSAYQLNFEKLLATKLWITNTCVHSLKRGHNHHVVLVSSMESSCDGRSVLAGHVSINVQM